MSYAAMARDVLEFAQDLHAGNVHILGHSMGGKVAMELAISYPQIVDRLVVVDVAPRAFHDSHPAVIEALKSLDLSRHRDRDSIEHELSKDFESAAVRQFLMKNLRMLDGRFVWRPNLDALEQSYGQIAGPVTAKGIFDGETLFIRGGRSDYVRDSDVVEIGRRFPAARIATIDTAGHWVHADAPDEFTRTVSEFLLSPVKTR
jgi:pimeloyl-ACP methyl ester carboxylesterase